MGKYAKAIVAVLAAAGMAAQAALVDGTVTPDELVAIGIAAVTAIGVLFVPNRPEPADVTE